MIDLIVRILINAAALIVAVPDRPEHPPRHRVHTSEAWIKVAAIALVFGLINTYLAPIVKPLSLPITLLTHGPGGDRDQRRDAAGPLGRDRRAQPAVQRGNFPPTVNADTIVAALIGGIIISLVAAVLSFALAARKVLGVPL